jgi:type IV pilus biogenesis protein CpaD/CtpE
MMNINLLAGLMVVLPLLAVGCAKKDPSVAASAEQNSSTAPQVTAEQQAAIDSLDKPNPEATEAASAEVAASATH